MMKWLKEELKDFNLIEEVKEFMFDIMFITLLFMIIILISGGI